MVKDSIPYSTVINESVDSTDITFRQNIFFAQNAHGDSISPASRDSLNTYIEEVGHEGVGLPFVIEQVDGIFGLLLFCFLFFTHIYNGGISFLQENVSLLFSLNKDQRVHRQTTAKEILYGYFLVFQAVVLMGICAYAILVEYDPKPQSAEHPLLAILSFIILIGVFFGIKDLAFRIIGYIFDMDKGMALWRRSQVVAIEILGILYFIPTLLLVYANAYHFQIAIFMVILFLIVEIILFYQIIVFFVKEKFNFLYLIAYLCTFEILPCIFLIIGLFYLYQTDVFNIIWL